MLRMVNLLTPGLNLEFSGSKAIILTLTPEAKVSHARNKQKKKEKEKAGEERNGRRGKGRGRMEGKRGWRRGEGIAETCIHVRQHHI